MPDATAALEGAPSRPRHARYWIAPDGGDKLFAAPLSVHKTLTLLIVFVASAPRGNDSIALRQPTSSGGARSVSFLPVR